MNIRPDFNQNEKVIRVIEYLLRIASLRTKLIRDIADYKRAFWFKDVPRQKGCFTQAWGRYEECDEDVWLEIQNRREPELPSVPEQCKDWIDKNALRNKNDLPELLPQITKQLRNPGWKQGSDQPEFIQRTARLDDHPEIQKAWNRYLEERWLLWVEEHNTWESIHEIYSSLFAIHQEQLRLGEEYELVLGLGLLTWQTSNGQRVRRHLIVANALLEFEARLGKFTVRPMPASADVRPELDMLDVEEQPIRAEERAKSLLTKAEDDPWSKDCVEGVLKVLVHSINPHGEYDSTLEPKKNIRVSAKPIVEYAPALILRKRSTRGLTEMLKRIKERVENGEEVPTGFKDLAETRNNADSENDPEDTRVGFDGEVFFPKPSNEEQRRIVDKIQAASGVLVQGPPGTGKSHTIANLICHLLAKGQRMLITAKTPRALKVLEGLVPDELRPLCINLLGSGLEEKRSLESSVGGMLHKNEEWNENQATRARKELEQKLRNLRDEKAQVNRRLRTIRESETHPQSIANGTYRGTAARIAEAVNRDRSIYEWFADAAPLNKACPISESDLQRVLADLRRFTTEKRQELNFAWPDDLPALEGISSLFESEKRAVEEEAHLIKKADEQTADHLVSVDVSAIETIRDSLTAFQGEYQRLSTSSSYPWMHDALRDVVNGNPSLWRERHRVTRKAIGSTETLVSVADETIIDFPDEVNIKTLFKDALRLKEHLENGGKLGWGLFRPKPVRKRVYVLQVVRINGHPCSTLEHFSVLVDALQVRAEFKKAWESWAGRSEKTPGPYALQLAALRAQWDALCNVLSLEKLIKSCRENIQRCPALSEPVWAEKSQIERLIASCRLALVRHKKRLAAEEIRDIEVPLVALVAKSAAHPVTGELVEAIRNRKVDAYAHAASKVSDLEKERRCLQRVDEDILKMRYVVPKLTDELERTCDDNCWEKRIEEISNTWRWAQARFWIEKYIRKEDAPALAKRARQIENEINATIEKLASLHAWSFCFSRLKENHRRHMEAWQQSMRRLGKGTGKHAPRHRRAAQQHLNKCREAVPAWVMPLHRVWDTVDPVPGMFDVIIVDEASQCGLEALPLFYLSKKMLIVGDDKQISPEAVGLPRDAVHRLMEEFFHDFQFKSTFDVESSLFDHGKLRYGTRRITLREHFRCMPEIIRFSNELCYSDAPLIPLRQYGPDRLEPLKHVFVEGGYREGTNNRAINRPEADAIAETIVELCRDPKYAEKTMGVVVLQGDAQAGLIEEKLLNFLGAEEMEKRRLICGNPYSFQGNERDVMFLSMVAATNERIGPLTKAADERRFNVAASRARDQMWLFYSVRREDLSTSCLRRKLLEFFEDTHPHRIAGIEKDELERRAAQDNRTVIKPPPPFDSWFEVDVALELARKGYNVIPQYEVAGKRIDLVVEGGRARLAVECDGDKYHGVDRYDEDMQRQRMLERCGWEFFRVRESAFYLDKRSALQGLWRMLEERGITPVSRVAAEHSECGSDNEGQEQLDCRKTVENNKDRNCGRPLLNGSEGAPVPSDVVPPLFAELRRRKTEAINLYQDLQHQKNLITGRSGAEGVTASKIQDTILRVLSKSPRQFHTVSSLTSRVYKELGFLDLPHQWPIKKEEDSYKIFEQRVISTLDILKDQGYIEGGEKGRNSRIKLLNLAFHTTKKKGGYR